MKGPRLFAENSKFTLVPCSLVPLFLLPLHDHDDLVGRNGALAQNLPAAGAQRKIDDGGRLRAARGTAVDNQRNAVAYLIADAACFRALRRSLQVGRGSRDRSEE